MMRPSIAFGSAAVLAAALVLAACLGPEAIGANTKPASLNPLAEGELLWRSGSVTVRLTQAPCAFPELEEALVGEDGIPPAKASVVVLPGVGRVAGCWMPDFSGDILAVDIAGSGGFIPLNWFTRDPGI